MKKILWLFVCILSLYSVSDGAIVSHGGVGDDGVISKGEYDYGDIRVTYSSTLTVDGGGAGGIIAEDHSQVDILSTSLPLSGDIDGGGVWSILMWDDSSLYFSGGATNIIYMTSDSTALLTGGQINNIMSLQTVSNCYDKHITIVCKNDWEWIYENDIIEGITGKWLDGTAFTINFINDEDYNYVYENIHIMPEPASLTLFVFGGIFLKRKYK